MNEEIELGQTYKHKVSAFVGVATGRANYLYGCDQIQLTAKSDDPLKHETKWFDPQELERA